MKCWRWAHGRQIYKPNPVLHPVTSGLNPLPLQTQIYLRCKIFTWSFFDWQMKSHREIVSSFHLTYTPTVFVFAAKIILFIYHFITDSLLALQKLIELFFFITERFLKPHFSWEPAGGWSLKCLSHHIKPWKKSFRSCVYRWTWFEYCVFSHFYAGRSAGLGESLHLILVR